jgi:hypothetical protein
MMKPAIALSLLLFLSRAPLAAAEAPAAPPAGHAAQAAELLRLGRPAEAYDLLSPRHAADKNDVETAFLLGQAAQALGCPAEAAGIYEGILKKNKALPRVRLELARAYASLGETKKARDQFMAVLAGSPPPLVGENINKYMASMQAPKSWNARAGLGFIYDSNINAGPEARTVLMFGAPFRLSDDARRTAGHGYTASLDAGWMREFRPGLALQADAGYSRARYAGLHNFDSDSFSASAGPTFGGRGFVLSSPVIFENLRVAHERYNLAYGLAPQVMVPLGGPLSADASLVLQRKKYFVGGGARSGPVWAASAGLKYRYGRDAFVRAGFRHAAESTSEDYLDNASDSFSAGWYSGLPRGFSLYAGPGVTLTRYAAAEAAYDERRRDAQYSGVLNLSREFPAAGLSATAGFTYTRNDSNLGLYDYVRRQLTLRLSLAF